MAMEWISKGYDDFKKKWTTYLGLIFIGLLVEGGAVLLALMLSPGILLSTQPGPMGYGTAGAVNYTVITIMLILSVLIIDYFGAALFSVYTLENGGIKAALKKGWKKFIPLLVISILISVIITLPVPILWFLGIFLSPIIAIILAIIGLLVSVYLLIKFVTAAGRIFYGEGVIESLVNSWNTSFVDSLKVALVILLLDIIGAFIGVIPFIGALLNIFLIEPIIIATYMAAVEDVKQKQQSTTA